LGLPSPLADVCEKNGVSIIVPKSVIGSVGLKDTGLNTIDLQNLRYTVYVTYDEGSNFKIAFKEPRLQERIFGDWFDKITIFAFLDTITGFSVLIFIIPYAHHIY
jgi:hypothetical protein